jgi:parallel beta-helix repeat protein
MKFINNVISCKKIGTITLLHEHAKYHSTNILYKYNLAFFMRRGIAVIWISILLILTNIIFISEYSDYDSNVKGAMIYVNETGSDGAFTSIQDAINASSDGDTVFVYSGMYNENIVVNRSIDLIGESADLSTINGSDSEHIVIIESDFVNISGLTVKCGGVGGWPNVISGLVLENVTSCGIFGNIISDCYPGVNLYYTHDNIITGNNISNNEDGVWLRYSNNNSITYNTLMYNDIAIDGVNAGTNNMISHNEISHNAEGIYLYYTSDNLVSYNNCTNIDWSGIYLYITDNITILNNNYSICYTGIDISSSSNITINNNIMLWNQDYGILCQNTDDVHIRNNIVEYSLYGFDIYNINRLILTNNYMSAEWRALDLSNSLYGYIANNTIANCPDEGINIWSISEYNLITNNTFFNISYAFWTDGSEYNIISENTFLNNSYALTVWDSFSYDIIKNEFFNNEYAIYFWEDVLSCNITGNNVSSNVNGIYLDQIDNDYNRITENIVANNDNGIYISLSNHNTIYHNNIMDNTVQAYDDSTNKWDNDYPMGGNFWSDYSGVDLFKGPNQDIPGSDGIGDTNYSIDSDSFDNYPLMEEFTTRGFENYTILKNGWNFVSIPLIQEDQNITTVLEMIDGYYDVVSWYDASDPDDHWKSYIVEKPFGNDLLHLNETMGFMIHITKTGDTIFLYNGTPPTQNQTIWLYEGWNMVGYPSESSYNRTEGLNNLTFGVEVDEIEWYDATTKTWYEMNENDEFVPTRGYWIHTTSDCEWEVPL